MANIIQLTNLQSWEQAAPRLNANFASLYQDIQDLSVKLSNTAATPKASASDVGSYDLSEYATKAMLSDYSPVGHTHSINDVTDLSDTLSNLVTKDQMVEEIAKVDVVYTDHLETWFKFTEEQTTPTQPSDENPSDWTSTEPQFTEQNKDMFLWQSVKTVMTNGSYHWSAPVLAPNFESAKAVYQRMTDLDQDQEAALSAAISTMQATISALSKRVDEDDHTHLIYRSPFLKCTEDWNELAPGIYNVTGFNVTEFSSSLNQPVGGYKYGTLYVTKNENYPLPGTYITQTYMEHGYAKNGGAIWMRQSYATSGWTPWRKTLTTTTNEQVNEDTDWNTLRSGIYLVRPTDSSLTNAEMMTTTNHGPVGAYKYGTLICFKHELTRIVQVYFCQDEINNVWTRYKHSSSVNWTEWANIASQNKSNKFTKANTFTATTTFSKTQDASGTANNSPALIVGGTSTTQHLELDSNEIMSKSDGTTPAALCLNQDGGAVTIGANVDSDHGRLLVNGVSVRDASILNRGTIDKARLPKLIKSKDISAASQTLSANAAATITITTAPDSGYNYIAAMAITTGNVNTTVRGWDVDTGKMTVYVKNLTSSSQTVTVKCQMLEFATGLWG